MSRLDDIIAETLRSTYGASQPNLTGGSRGGGASDRKGGGRGTPGYPVPPEMEDGDDRRFPYMHEGEEVPKSPVQDDPGHDPNVGYSDLHEGGNAMGTDRVPRENVTPTIKEYERQVLSKVKHKSVKPVGSTGKKASSGDLDLGLDTDLSLEQISAILKKLGVEHKVAKGLGEINSKFPQYDSKGKKTGLSAQVDLMVGPEAWTQFSYYGPGEDESKYKALPRTGLVLAILKFATEQKQSDGSTTFYSISPAKGVFKKVGRTVKNKKGEDEFKSDRVDATNISDPNEVAKLISQGTGVSWTVKDLAQPFEKVWAKAKTSFKPDKLEHVKGYLKGFLKGVKVDAPSELDEADGPKDLPKGISHLEDMKPEDFLRFLEKYKDMPLKGGLEVSEKVDGSARISFGADNGKLWTQSKNGQKKYGDAEYGDNPIFAALRNAHKALTSKPALAKSIPPGAFFVAEVLYTKIPNSIEYGPNVIMIHGVHKGDVVLSDEGSRKVATDLIKKTGGQLSDGKDPWKFEYKRVIKPEDVMVDVKEEFDSLGEIYQELKKLEPDKLKAVGKGPYKMALGKFQAIQKALKEKLVGQLRKQQSSYGPPGGDVEGLVFRDLESGQLTKLVDKELFTKLNTFNWTFRGLIGKGVKLGDTWRSGVISDFRKSVATDVIGRPEAASTAFGKQLATLAKDVKYPAGADTPEKKADVLLAQWIKKNNAFGGKDPSATFSAQVAKAQAEMKKLEAEWAIVKKKGPTVQLKGQTRKMDPLVIQRTDQDFQGAHQSLIDLKGAADAIGGLHGDMTKKVAIMKLFLGQHRLERIQGGGGEEPTEESLVREAGPPPVPVDQRKVAMSAGGKHALGIDTAGATAVIQKNADKLARKGINAKQARALGQGTRGVAFDVGGNRVLKITNDGQEAVAAFKLKEFNLKHVARFFDVFRFRDPDPKLGELYGILQEKLEPLPGMGSDPSGTNASGEAAELNKAIIAFDLQPTIYHSGYNWKQTMQACQQKIYETIKKRYPNFQTDEIDKKYASQYAEKMNAQWKIITKKFHIDEMVEELSAKGVKFHDYHAGNIMMRPNGEYALIDIGFSKVAGGKEPPVLERIMKEMVAYLGEGGWEHSSGGKAGNTPTSQQKKRLSHIKNAVKGKKIQGELSVADAVKQAAPLLKKHGIVPKKMLGHGSYGIAYDLGGGKVLKVTTDPLEAKSSNHIKGKKLKHVVNIFDVFQLPGTEYFGIVEEKLTQMSAYDKKEFELVTDLLQACKAGEALLSGDYDRVLEKVRTNIKDRGVQKLMDEQMRQFQLPEIIRELAKEKVEFLDYHQENLMMRGNDYVVIDLGLSQSPGKAPPVLESAIRQMFLEFSGRERAHGMGPTPDRQEYVGVDGNLVNHTDDGEVDKYATNISEAAADTIGVTIGRFQPFHRGHAEVIRNLARTHTKVIVLIAGNTPDKKNPFSYDTRLKVMKDSLPDVWRKLEVYKATAGGKNSGFIPGVLGDVIDSGKSAIKGDTAIEILVGPDRFDQMKQQLDRAKQYKAQNQESAFDPELAVIKKLPGVKNDDDTDRISGTRVRMALQQNDKESFKKMMDPHLVSNPGIFEDDYEKLRKELEKYGPLKEDLTHVGGAAGIIGILNSHAQRLETEKHIKVKDLKKLGEGQMGVAFDMGGGKVLKVTTDVSEAKNAMLLKGKTLPHVVQVFDVFRITDRRNEKVPVYCVERQNLTPLAPNEVSELNDLVDLLRDDSLIHTTANGDFDATMKAVRALMTKEVRRDLDLPEQVPADPAIIQSNKREIKAKALVEQKYTELEARLKHFQVDAMMHDLKSVGVRFADYKGDNVMKRGGNYVLIDFGGGKSPGPEPPLLETIVETIISEIGMTYNSNTPGSTQSGLRAGSSGWSSPQNMYTADDVADFRDEPDEFELWSDKLKGVDTAKAIGEEFMKLMEKTALKTADRASNQFEHQVAQSLTDQGIQAKAVGGNDPKKADVEVSIGGKSAYIEAKYTEAGGANLVSARMKLVDGKWQGAGEQTGFTAGIAKDLEKNPDAQKFLKDLYAFVAKYRKDKGMPVPKALSMPAQGKPEDIMKRNPSAVTPDEINAFIENKKSSGKGNRYIYLDVEASDVQRLVAAHYKYKNAPYMQFGNDFYLLGDDDPFGLSKLNPPVPQFQVTQGRKGVRVASRTGRYEIIPELKALRVFPSPYSLVDPKKKFPFKKTK